MHESCAESNSDQLYVHKSTSISGYNQFVGDNAGMAPSLLQLKVLYYGLSKAAATGNMTVRFSVREFWQNNGIKAMSKQHTTILLKCVPNVMKRLLFKGEINPKTGKPRVRILHWVQSACIDETKNGLEIELQFTPELREDVLQEDHPIAISIQTINKMNSKYSPRLYDMLLVSLVGGYSSAVIERSLDDIRAFLDATNVKRTTELRRDVIEPAVREINEHTSMHVEFELLKTGRSYTHVRFTVIKAEQSPLLPAESGLDERKQSDSVDDVLAAIREQIDYDAILSDMEATSTAGDTASILKLIVEVMASVYRTTAEKTPFYKIAMNGSTRNVPYNEVLARLQELDQFHVLHVIENVRNYQKTIRNPSGFVLACLFNAPLTMDIKELSAFNESWEKAAQAEAEAEAERRRCEEIRRIFESDADFT